MCLNPEVLNRSQIISMFGWFSHIQIGLYLNLDHQILPSKVENYFVKKDGKVPSSQERVPKQCTKHTQSNKFCIYAFHSIQSWVFLFFEAKVKVAC
jgi:hypothetical protein